MHLAKGSRTRPQGNANVVEENEKRKKDTVAAIAAAAMDAINSSDYPGCAGIDISVSVSIRMVQEMASSPSE